MALELVLRKKIRDLNTDSSNQMGLSAEKAAEQLAQINQVKDKIKSLKKRSFGNTYEQALKYMGVDNFTAPQMRKRLRQTKIQKDLGVPRLKDIMKRERHRS